MACAGCKGTLTRWLRSRKYTRDELLTMRYDHFTSKWKPFVLDSEHGSSRT